LDSGSEREKGAAEESKVRQQVTELEKQLKKTQDELKFSREEFKYLHDEFKATAPARPETQSVPAVAPKRRAATITATVSTTASTNVAPVVPKLTIVLPDAPAEVLEVMTPETEVEHESETVSAAAEPVSQAMDESPVSEVSVLESPSLADLTPELVLPASLDATEEVEEGGHPGTRSAKRHKRAASASSAVKTPRALKTPRSSKTPKATKLTEAPKNPKTPRASLGTVKTTIPKCRTGKPKADAFDDVLKTDDVVVDVDVAREDGRRLRTELKSIKSDLSDISKGWEIRVKLLNRLTDMILKEGLTKVTGFSDELSGLKAALSAQLHDLRSGVITVACKTLIGLAAVMGEDFADLMSYFLPVLFKGLYVTIKIISVSADQCMKALINHCHSTKYFSQLFLGASDTHGIVRRKCAEYLSHWLQLCDATEDAAVLQGLKSRFATVVTSNIADQDKDVRVATRTLYEAFANHYPADADAMFDEFEDQTKRAITTDRNQRAKDEAKRQPRKRKSTGA
jgi:hypothetical protein